KAIKRKESQARKIFKQLTTESAKIARQTLGSTDSDNTAEFGKKFKKSLKQSLKSQAVSKTQSYINSKANEFANKFGQGRTEISLSGITSEAINYHIRTIQPLSNLNKNSQDLTFIQAQIASGADKGDRRETFNLGIGYRKLLEQGQSIIGINLFTDYESKSKHRRASIGAEYQRSNFTANVNSYFSLSDKTIVNGKSEEVQNGYDIRLTGQIPYLPWAKIRATQYYWKGRQGANISGNVLGFETQISDSTRLEIGSSNNDNSDRETYARLSVLLPVEKDKPTNFIVDDKPFKSSSKMQLSELKWVERSNVIRVEKAKNNNTAIIGAFKGAVEGATCEATDSNGKTISKNTDDKGVASVANPAFATGLLLLSCSSGFYVDEATSAPRVASPILRAAIDYKGGSVKLIATPLSEIAYRLAGGSAYDAQHSTETATVLAKLKANISDKNAEVASVFGISGVDFTKTIPIDIFTTKALPNATGKTAAILAAISEYTTTAATPNSPSFTIADLLNKIKVGNINTEIINGLNDFMANDSAIGGGKANIDNNIREAADAIIKELNDILASIEIIKKYADDDVANPAPEVETYAKAGVDGVIARNLEEINQAVADVTGAEVDTTRKIQALVNSVIYAIKISPQTRSIAENSAVQTAVGAKLILENGDPATFTFDDSSIFSINNSGQISVASAQLDFETQQTYILTVTVSSNKIDVADKSTTITVVVTDVKEAATFTVSGITSKTIAENLVFTSATPNPITTAIGFTTWTLGGLDATEFTIDATTGVVTSNSEFDFENPTDSDSNNICELTVTATDDDDNKAAKNIT
ncbi:MAG: hypothetical protein FXV79_05575, partial [Candidatus Thioglobus sp.]